MKKGKLILFSSYAPGAGKTYEMLKYIDGLDNNKSIYWGYVNCSFRTYKYMPNENIQLFKNGKQYCVEIDINTILIMKPDIVIIDELAFFNTCTKHFLYIDILNILKHGITVITSCNMQIFNAVGRICYQYSKIIYKNLVPDSFLEKVDKVYFINTNPKTILERYNNNLLFRDKGKITKSFYNEEVLEKYREVSLMKIYEMVGGEITII